MLYWLLPLHGIWSLRKKTPQQCGHGNCASDTLSNDTGSMRLHLETKLNKQEGELKMHDLRSKIKSTELQLEIDRTQEEIDKLNKSLFGSRVKVCLLKLILPVLLVCAVSLVVMCIFRMKKGVILLTIAIDVFAVIIIGVHYHFVKR